MLTNCGHVHAVDAWTYEKCDSINSVTGNSHRSGLEKLPYLSTPCKTILDAQSHFSIVSIRPYPKFRAKFRICDAKSFWYGNQ